MNKFIFLDLDGTLLDDQKAIPPSAAKAIRLAQEKGHKLIVATGRSHTSIVPEIRKLGFDGFIYSAGAVVEIEKKTIFKNKMDSALVGKLIDVMDQHDIGYILEGYHHSFYNQRFIDYLKSRKALGKIKPAFQSMESYQHGTSKVYKIAFFASDLAHAKILESKLKDCSEISVFTHQQISGDLINGEITSIGVTKASGIKLLMSHIAEPLDHTISFGDSLNDLEMLAITKTGVCMGNGVKDLKDIADDITETPANDGIYKAFVKHGLI
jgi:hypothetical protein